MQYILLDMEWNNAYCVKTHGFINEIVEFGAIKLDADFNEVDRFSQIVRSSLTKRLNGRFKELTGMTNAEMLDGIPFREVLTAYKNWAGKDCITMTWSNSDLYALYENCLHFTDDFHHASIGRYVDLQQYFHSEIALAGHPEKNQMSLANAAAYLHITLDDIALHHATDDSEIAAAIFKKCYVRKRFEPFIINTDSELFFEKLTFRPYYIHNMDSRFIDKSSLKVCCELCGTRAKQLTKWAFKNRWFKADFYCKKCGHTFSAGLSFRRYFDYTAMKRKYYVAANNNLKDLQNNIHKETPPVKQ